MCPTTPFDEDDDIGTLFVPSITQPQTHQKFDMSLVNADQALNDMLQRMKFVGEKAGLNMIFYGLPGTGKSQYAQYVASYFEQPILTLSSADILYSKIGISERVIRAAFATAARMHAVILIDEADSLLYDRKNADRNWEVLLVNEFIQCLDQHTQPVICTTNYIEECDAAILRRFMFKAKFSPLTQEQKRQAFAIYFNTPYPDYLDSLKDMTVADFGLAYKKAKVLGYLHDTPKLLELFYAEAMARFNYANNADQRRKPKKAA